MLENSLPTIVAIISHNDEFEFELRLFTTQFFYKVLLSRYMKVKRIGIKEILRRIWLLSAKKVKSSQSICKQSSHKALKRVFKTKED